MFNKKNDPLIESVKGVMEQNELHRRVEAAVNEHFGIESRAALPHEHHAEYDAVLAEEKKKLEESDHKPDSPDHHRAMAIRAHKAMKAGDKSEITANKKKRHEKAYKEMTGNKIKYPDSVNEKVEPEKYSKKQKRFAKLGNVSGHGGDPEEIDDKDLKAARGGHAHKVGLEEKAPPGDKYERMVKHIKSSQKDKPEEVKKRSAYATAWKAYGKKHGKTEEKQLEEEMDIDLIMEEIRSNLLEELNYVYENYDEASFADYVNSLSEEQIEILGLDEGAWDVAKDLWNRKFNSDSVADAKARFKAGVQNLAGNKAGAKNTINNQFTNKEIKGMGGNYGSPAAKSKTNTVGKSPSSQTKVASKTNNPTPKPMAKPSNSGGTAGANMSAGDITKRSLTGMNEEQFEEFYNSLSEEQIGMLGLNEAGALVPLGRAAYAALGAGGRGVVPHSTPLKPKFGGGSGGGPAPKQLTGPSSVPKQLTGPRTAITTPKPSGLKNAVKTGLGVAAVGAAGSLGGSTPNSSTGSGSTKPSSKVTPSKVGRSSGTNKPMVAKTSKPKTEPKRNFGFDVGRKGNPQTGTSPKGLSAGQETNRVLGGVYEEAPTQIKESFEQFVRKFLKG